MHDTYRKKVWGLPLQHTQVHDSTCSYHLTSTHSCTLFLSKAITRSLVEGGVVCCTHMPYHVCSNSSNSHYQESTAIPEDVHCCTSSHHKEQVGGFHTFITLTCHPAPLMSAVLTLSFLSLLHQSFPSTFFTDCLSSHLKGKKMTFISQLAHTDIMLSRSLHHSDIPYLHIHVFSLGAVTQLNPSSFIHTQTHTLQRTTDGAI